MKTKDKILYKSLELFNHEGEPNVTTMDIAQELDMSPGNLYYHFRNKDEIVLELYKLFQKAYTPRLEELEQCLVGLENQPLVISCLFETAWTYRFLFLDCHQITQKYSSLKKRLHWLLIRKRMAYLHLLETLTELDLLVFDTRSSLELLVDNLTTVSFSWMNYATLRNKTLSEHALSQGVAQMMALLTAHFKNTNNASINTQKTEANLQ